MIRGQRQNRRRSERIRLSKPLVCRLETFGVVLIDISNHGARIEHYVRLQRGQERSLRLRWEGDDLILPATIVSCRVERFVPGEGGLTVYRSGLQFINTDGTEHETIRKLTTAIVAGTLVEQVANAKGFAPPTKGEMPIFSGSSLVSNRFDISASRPDEHLLPEKEVVRQVGFIRFALEKRVWTRKWTLDPHQPHEGFTVSANETWDQVESLCELYRSSNDEGRRFIRLLAEASVESQIEENSRIMSPRS
ncbi:MAG TPA: PilZ domain-containing protein [Thermoanaerobaculia bacterium]|nr:PilZ domain-containing protein [Thermoanaerobaculia bacterium]